MSASGGNRAIFAALGANVGIAVVKFIAAAISGSASMLAEGVHSLADSANQLLLLLGGRRARRAADEEHPFGYGRERYVYAFVVSIVLFSVGGVFSLYEGIEKFADPHPLDNWWLPMLVLVIAIGLEGFSLRTALKEAAPHKGSMSWVQYVRRAKAPELPVVMLEDTAALTGLVFALFGVGLTALTGNGVFDAIGTVLIAVLLIAVALVLGVETKSLLVGEGASAADVAAIKAALLDGPEIESIIHIKTLYLGPDELMVGVKVAVDGDRRLGDVAAGIDAVEQRVRRAVPVARVDLRRAGRAADGSAAADRGDRDPRGGLAVGASAARVPAVGASASVGEERVQQGGALGLEHARDHLGPVRQPSVPGDVVDAAGRPRLRVPGTEHDARDASGQDRARAHRARLERDDQGVPVEVPVARHRRCRAERQDLGVGRGVLRGLALVAPRGDDRAALVDHDGAHGDVPRRQARPGLGECLRHGGAPRPACWVVHGVLLLGSVLRRGRPSAHGTVRSTLCESTSPTTRSSPTSSRCSATGPHPRPRSGR